ncbi:hypothetical protein C8Q77DRAFT_1209730, partial [Trametes polyzona]
MSVMFTPAFQIDGILPDLVLLSSDNVTFHTHRQRLLAASNNAFGGLLAQQQASLRVPQSSAVLNVVLHLIYGMSCVHFQPALETTEAAIDALVAYGVTREDLAGSRPLHQLILSYAPYRPIEAYALAAHHNLEDTAVAVSAHLLAYDVSKLSDELTVKMGSVYFSRLYNLQRARLAALRNIVLRPPATHPLTPICNEEIQRELARAWAFASAEIVWNALPSKDPLDTLLSPLVSLSYPYTMTVRHYSTSIGALQSAFTSAGSAISCPDCQAMLRNRIAEVTNEWSAVKVENDLMLGVCAVSDEDISTMCSGPSPRYHPNDEFTPSCILRPAPAYSYPPMYPTFSL